MKKNNDPNARGKLIRCLSLLESKTSSLYRTLSDKIELPFVRSITLVIAQDSQKHSTILKGIGESLSKENVKTKDCEKNTGVTWRTIESLQRELSKKEKLSDSDLLAISERLNILESTVGEEYYIFVQLTTLQVLVNEINKNYDVDLGSLKTVFAEIISDEEHHRELIGKAIELIERRREKRVSSPFVKYQNPDAWIQPTD